MAPGSIGTDLQRTYLLLVCQLIDPRIPESDKDKYVRYLDMLDPHLDRGEHEIGELLILLDDWRQARWTYRSAKPPLPDPAAAEKHNDYSYHTDQLRQGAERASLKLVWRDCERLEDLGLVTDWSTAEGRAA
ncbi:MAG: hypothetical protein AAF674_16615 [Pseudomonadota bacterium]